MSKALGILIILITLVATCFLVLHFAPDPKPDTRWTVLSETYFVRGEDSADDLMVKANKFAESMQTGRKITMRILTNEANGVFGVLVITEEKK